MTSAAPAGVEPSLALAARPLLRLFLATRPAFLTVTIVAVLLGLACVWNARHVIDPMLAALTLLFALLAYAGANVVNDFHDVDTDALNTERVFPFTGGSRFIQNGVMTRRDMAWLGYLLLASVIPAGLWLVSGVGSGLLGIGVVGLLAAWGYSAQPLRLSAHGLGVLTITLGWALVVIGTAYVQETGISPLATALGIAYGLMVANLLYINQFPDASADALAGKRTWVVRLGRNKAISGYALIVCFEVITLVLAVSAGLLNRWALLSLSALLPSWTAYRQLQRFANEPARLVPAITATILATHLFGLFLIVALIL